MTDVEASPQRRIDWAGDRNLFAGWKGFFARGREPTIRVGDLAQARSTWNATEQGSQPILYAWPPLPSDLAEVTPACLSPYLPNRPSLMSEPARPGPGLFGRTVLVYPDPLIPEVPPAAAPASQSGVVRPGPMPVKVPTRDTRPGVVAEPPQAGSRQPSVMKIPAPSGSLDLTFNTADQSWGGDLGAFLRDQIGRGARHLRVRVEGAGSHRFTPVRLPEGMKLEISVDAPPSAELLSWSPDPQARGSGLLVVNGGSLVLSNVILHLEPDSQVQSLLDVNDGHLVLLRCQLTVPPGSSNVSGELIAFRATTTKPLPETPGVSPFLVPVNRPVCRLIDTILIGRRAAIRAEMAPGIDRTDPMRRCGRGYGHRAEPRRRGAGLVRRRPLAGAMHRGRGAVDRPAGAMGGQASGA